MGSNAPDLALLRDQVRASIFSSQTPASCPVESLDSAQVVIPPAITRKSSELFKNSAATTAKPVVAIPNSAEDASPSPIAWVALNGHQSPENVGFSSAASISIPLSDPRVSSATSGQEFTRPMTSPPASIPHVEADQNGVPSARTSDRSPVRPESINERITGFCSSDPIPAVFAKDQVRASLLPSSPSALSVSVEEIESPQSGSFQASNQTPLQFSKDSVVSFSNFNAATAHPPVVSTSNPGEEPQPWQTASVTQKVNRSDPASISIPLSDPRISSATPRSNAAPVTSSNSAISDAKPGSTNVSSGRFGLTGSISVPKSISKKRNRISLDAFPRNNTPQSGINTASSIIADRAVFVTFFEEGSEEECRRILDSCGDIIRCEGMKSNRAVFIVEFSNESSVEMSLKVIDPTCIVVRYVSAPAREPQKPEASPGTRKTSQSGVPSTEDDKEEGELSDSEVDDFHQQPIFPDDVDQVLMQHQPLDRFPDRPASEYSQRPSMHWSQQPESAMFQSSLYDPYSMAPSRRYDAPEAPPLPFPKYTIKPPYGGRQRMPLPSIEVPAFHSHYPPVFRPISPDRRRSPPNRFGPFAEDSPPFADRRRSASPRSIPLASQIPPPNSSQMTDDQLAELKRRALQSKPLRRSTSDMSARVQEVAPDGNSEAARFLSSVVSAAAAPFTPEAQPLSLPSADTATTISASATLPDVSPPVKPVAVSPAGLPRRPVLSATPTASTSANGITPRPALQIPRSPSRVIPRSVSLESSTNIPAVARKPDDRFVIHIEDDEEMTDDDSEESGAALRSSGSANINNGAHHLHRIKSSVELLRQKIAAAEAANSNNDNNVISQPNPSGPSLAPTVRKRPQPFMNTPVPDSTKRQRQQGNSQGTVIDVPSTPTLLHLQRANDIKQLNEQILLLVNRRAMLRTRLTIVKEQSSRLSNMIDRCGVEIVQARVKLSTLSNQSTDNLTSAPRPLPAPESNAVAVSINPRDTRDTVNVEDRSKPERTVDVAAAVDKLKLAASEFIMPLESSGDVAHAEYLSNSVASDSTDLVREFRYVSPLTCLRSQHRIHNPSPNSTICQFALFGHCNDDSCKQLHISTSGSSVALKSNFVEPTLAPSAPVNAVIAQLQDPKRRVASSNVESPIDIRQSGMVDDDDSDEKLREFVAVEQRPLDNDDHSAMFAIVINTLTEALSLEEDPETDRYFTDGCGVRDSHPMSEEMLREDPSNPDLWLRHAICVAESSRHRPVESVIPILSRAVDANTGSVTLWTVYLSVLQMGSKLSQEEVLSLCNVALRCTNDSPALWRVLIDLTPCDYDSRRSVILRAIDAVPADVSFMLRLIDIDVDTGHVDVAKMSIQQALQRGFSCQYSLADRLLLAITLLFTSSFHMLPITLQSCEAVVSDFAPIALFHHQWPVLVAKPSSESLSLCLKIFLDTDTGVESLRCVNFLLSVCRTIAPVSSSIEYADRLQNLPEYYYWALFVDPELSRQQCISQFNGHASVMFTAACAASSNSDALAILSAFVSSNVESPLNPEAARLAISDMASSPNLEPDFWVCFGLFHALLRAVNGNLSCDFSLVFDVPVRKMSGVPGGASGRRRLQKGLYIRGLWSIVVAETKFDIRVFLDVDDDDKNLSTTPTSVSANLAVFADIVDTVSRCANYQDHFATLSIVEQAALTRPHSIGLGIQLALCYVDAGRSFASVSVLSRIVTAFPRCVPAWSMLAFVQIARGRIYAAASVYRHAKELNPFSARLRDEAAKFFQEWEPVRETQDDRVSTGSPTTISPAL
uniref:C3H1-type domain-containing protein n=1 Tax=Spongospora subterranea TaxID=70186 RepID=A0A0H5R7L9_9EUKA|eukprot:CRZ10160.1 hypothetical protein [Spongospora subterranea]